MQKDTLNIIWDELKDILGHVEYSNLFIDQQLYRSRLFETTLSVISGSGAIGAVVSKYFPLVAVIFIFIIALLKQASSLFFRKNEDILKLKGLLFETNKLYNEIENLYIQLKGNKIKDIAALRKMNIIGNKFAVVKIDMSIIFGRINHKLHIRSSLKADQKLRRRFNITN